MKKIITYIGLLVLAFTPFLASAHAMPVSYMPDSSVTVLTAPKEVSIKLSERLEKGASQISVVGPSGKKISVGEATVDVNDPYLISVPIQDDGKGTYIVSWNVVSADDGHFTKGGYVFAVGAGVVANTTDASDIEVVQVATTPEVLGMTAEFIGNGMIWAILILFVFVIRPRKENLTPKEDKSIAHLYGSFALIGSILGILGALGEIIAKTQSLATVQSIAFSSAIPVYLSTVAGEATLYRLIALTFILFIFLVFKKKILSSLKLTSYEIALFVIMLVFAYFRAKISHATANPFHPGFSVFINFIHLIVKDMWAGLSIVSLALLVSKHLRDLLSRIIAKIFAIQAYVFGAVSVTACYIVWLHLKGFGNLFTTEWGGVFLELLAVASLLVLIRLYHVFARIFIRERFLKLLPVTYAAEVVMTILVIYCSSAILITSPPLDAPHGQYFSQTNQGITVELEKDTYEDGMVLVTVKSSATTSTPVLTLTNESNAGDPLSIDLSKRFYGGYVFPASFLIGAGSFKIDVTVPQQGGYDSQTSFELKASDFMLTEGEPARTFDSFTMIMCILALGAIILSIIVYKYSTREQTDTLDCKAPEFGAAVGFLITLLLSAFLLSAINGSMWSNPFKAMCVADGNAWHLMLPSKAGKPVSSRAAEGCMWGMGNYMYMFSDMREYSYYREMDKARATLTTLPQKLQAGAPTKLTVSLKNADGTPATLFVDMEKLIHMVIVSADQTVFAHIHADTEQGQARQTSTFNFSYTFPKAGKYLVSVDYAHGLQLESTQFTVDVNGSPKQQNDVATYRSPGTFGGYDVSVDFGQPYAGDVETFKYTISKDGVPVTDLEPYLSAPMHISVVKNDLSAFIHTHGEIHPPGVPYPPIIIKNGQVVHSMAMMTLPRVLGPTIEAHLIFPTSGVYTVWGEFKVHDTVIPTSFSVRVE